MVLTSFGGFGMVVTAWKNAKHPRSGAGYGLKVSAKDRDRYFKREWKSVTIELPTTTGGSKTTRVNTDKSSFWDKRCRELISKEIGLWLTEHKLAPWPKFSPPRLTLRPAGEAHFLLEATAT